MPSIFGFGKRRRKSVKRSKKASKPPSRLLKICRKYHVKATKKVGKHRVYKSVAVLKRMCLKKALAMKKKMMKAMKKGKTVHRRKRRPSMFGARTRIPMFGYPGEDQVTGMMKKLTGTSFGKRRGCAKVSKAAAMKAFKSFWKRHCDGARSSRFGNGGNPALNASMGYEFCPDGMGGVLGADSTGLFPNACRSASSTNGKTAFGRNWRFGEDDETTASQRSAEYRVERLKKNRGMMGTQNGYCNDMSGKNASECALSNKLWVTSSKFGRRRRCVSPVRRRRRRCVSPVRRRRRCVSPVRRRRRKCTKSVCRR